MWIIALRQNRINSLKSLKYGLEESLNCSYIFNYLNNKSYYNILAKHKD